MAQWQRDLILLVPAVPRRFFAPERPLRLARLVDEKRKIKNSNISLTSTYRFFEYFLIVARADAIRSNPAIMQSNNNASLDAAVNRTIARAQCDRLTFRETQGCKHVTFTQF